MKTYLIFSVTGRIIKVAAEAFTLTAPEGVFHFYVKDNVIASFLACQVIGVVVEANLAN